MNTFFRWSIATVLLAASSAQADWRFGKVQDVYFTYDGQMMTIKLVGVAKTGCTCYSPWSDRFCLNRARPTYREEVATVLQAKAAGANLAVNINETTCTVEALGMD